MKIVFLCCAVELLALAAGVVFDLNTILLAVIGLIGTSITGLIALKMATLSAAQKEAKVTTDKTAETMKEIHVAVNSKETITAKKIEDLTAMVLTLSETIKTLEENKRGAELAKAVATAQAPVVIQAPPKDQV